MIPAASPLVFTVLVYSQAPVHSFNKLVFTEQKQHKESFKHG